MKNLITISLLVAVIFFITSKSIAQTSDLQFINQASFTKGEAFGNSYTKQNIYSFMEYGDIKEGFSWCKYEPC